MNAKSPFIIPVVALLVGSVVGPVWAQSAAQKAALAELEKEPKIQEVHEASLRYFRVNLDQVDSMRTRAGIKAILPTLEVSGGYNESNIDESTFLDEYQPIGNGIPWVVRGADGSSFDVRGKATWDLPRLVFNAEQLDVAALAGLVQSLLKETTRLYYMRRRLQIDMILSPPTDQASLLSKRLRLDELTALLDAMTGGWFSESLAGKRVGSLVPEPSGAPAMPVRVVPVDTAKPGLVAIPEAPPVAPEAVEAPEGAQNSAPGAAATK